MSKMKTRKTATHEPPNTLAAVHAIPSGIASSSSSTLLKWMCTDRKVAAIAINMLNVHYTPPSSPGAQN